MGDEVGKAQEVVRNAQTKPAIGVKVFRQDSIQFGIAGRARLQPDDRHRLGFPIEETLGSGGVWTSRRLTSRRLRKRCSTALIRLQVPSSLVAKSGQLQ